MSQVITIEDLKAYSPNAVDSVRGQMIVDAVNAWVETRTNRFWGGTKNVVERYDWGKTLWLRHQDVTGIGSIKAGWPGQTQTTIAPDGYFFNSYGRVTLYWTMATASNQSAFYNDYLEVSYAYGNAEVADDLKMAALGIAAGFYTWAANGNRDVSAVSVGSYQITYANKRVGGSSAADPATTTADLNFSVIDSYRQRRQ